MEITGWCRFQEDENGLLRPAEERFASESDNMADVLLEDAWIWLLCRVIIGKKPLMIRTAEYRNRPFPRLVWRKVRAKVTRCTCGEPGCTTYETEFTYLKRRAVLAWDIFIEIE